MSIYDKAKGGVILKRLVYSKALADKWIKLGYKLVALSYFSDSNKGFTYHLEKSL
nr:MAG TPA: hypothetical protein [Caudoviricetes sp.]